MSKLIERLEKVDAASTPPLGFGASRPQGKPASMVLIAQPPHFAALQADFCIETPETIAVAIAEGDLKAVKATAGDTAWGIWPIEPAASESPVERAPREPLDELKEQGADFLVVGLDFQAEVLAEEGLGRVLLLPSPVPEELARSLEELPVDAVLVECGDSFEINLSDLVRVHSVRELTSKPLLVHVSCPLGKTEVTLLQDAGVQGLVVAFSNITAEEAAQIREAIDNLPPRKTKRDQPAPVVPRLASREASHPHEEDPDDRL